MDTLSLEMEISKILEIGAAISLDFQGREEELSQRGCPSWLLAFMNKLNPQWKRATLAPVRQNFHKRKANLDMKAYSGVNMEVVKITSNRSSSSFAEAVRGLPKTDNLKVSIVIFCKFADVKDKGSERLEVVSWDEEENDSRWLSYCDVGVFKKRFKSIDDRNAFIRSKELWEDLFSFVGGWSSAITPQCRLSWVEFRGIPLNVWCGEFFLKLGWAVDEPLLIEKETLNRENLFRGKVLTLISNGVSCPANIKVNMRKSFFSVSVREDSTPLDMDWISGKFGWDSGDSTISMDAGVNAPIMKQAFPTTEQLKASCSKTGGAAADKYTAFQLSVVKKSASSKVVQFDYMGLGSGYTKNGFLVKPKLACGFPKRAQLKEKGININNEDSNTSAAHLGHPNMELEKGKSVERSWLSEDIGESSLEESGEGFRLQSKILGGESSKAGLDHLVSGNHPKKKVGRDFDLSEGGGMGKELGPSFKEALLKGGPGLIPQAENSVGQRFKDSESEKEISSKVSLSSSENSISHVSEPQHLDGDNLVASVVANSSGRLRNVYSKKVVEKGVELGYLKFPKSVNNGGVANEGRGDSSAETWSLSEEVAKVIEMGVALGFDFNGSVEKVAAEISRREKDDEARYLATK
ncbi:hypothetical protein LWI28_026961 [Acer negundo]|uniref:DUF4283 domain-containing protein n=1 Tax=Acer negundo TaxID=4023 RepID=A0AAD5NYG0_ACENE|nr:hypothetical protein LWI28_026961 [Acer negundo]